MYQQIKQTIIHTQLTPSAENWVNKLATKLSTDLPTEGMSDYELHQRPIAGAVAQALLDVAKEFMLFYQGDITGGSYLQTLVKDSRNCVTRYRKADGTLSAPIQHTVGNNFPAGVDKMVHLEGPQLKALTQKYAKQHRINIKVETCHVDVSDNAKKRSVRFRSSMQSLRDAMIYFLTAVDAQIFKVEVAKQKQERYFWTRYYDDFCAQLGQDNYSRSFVKKKDVDYDYYEIVVRMLVRLAVFRYYDQVGINNSVMVFAEIEDNIWSQIYDGVWAHLQANHVSLSAEVEQCINKALAVFKRSVLLAFFPMSVVLQAYPKGIESGKLSKGLRKVIKKAEVMDDDVDEEAEREIWYDAKSELNPESVTLKPTAKEVLSTDLKSDKTLTKLAFNPLKETYLDDGKIRKSTAPAA